MKSETYKQMDIISAQGVFFTVYKELPVSILTHTFAKIDCVCRYRDCWVGSLLCWVCWVKIMFITNGFGIFVVWFDNG
jgi:hypothetical protein